MSGINPQPNYNNESFASSSSSTTTITLTPLQQQERQRQHLQQSLLEGDDLLPPPQREKQQKHPNNHYDHPPFPHPPSNLLSDSRKASTNSTIISGTGVLLAVDEDDDSDLTIESDSQDDEDEDGERVGQRNQNNTSFPSSTVSENLCLACDGICRCGGANGATVYVPVPLLDSSRSRIGTSGLKVKITMSSLSNGGSINKSHHYLPSHQLHQPIASTSKAYTSSNTIVISEDEDESYSPRNNHKKSKISGSGASTPTGSVTSSTTSITKKNKGKKEKLTSSSSAFDVFSNKETSYSYYPNQKDSSTSTSASSSTTSTTTRKVKPLHVPSRSSLRQVLAISSKETPPPSPPHVISTFTSPLHHHHEKIKYDQEVSDFDLDGENGTTSNNSSDSSSSTDDDEDSSGEVDQRGGRIEKAEERALRREFEVGNGESTEDDMSDLEMDEWEELKKSRSKSNGKSVEKNEKKESIKSKSVFETEGEDEEEDEDVGITDLPLTGGRGVVTWSDYDSVGQDEEEDDDEELEEGDEGGEFEDELEELFALSEAVVGPVRDGEYGEMWLEEISNLGDDESNSDLEGEESDQDDTTIVVMDRWGVNYSRRSHRTSRSGSSDSAASDSDDYDDDDIMAAFDDDEDGGDTTDSLDSDDHIGMVRFGIEVETESEASSSSDEMSRDLYRHFAPGTASLADVQAPTSADLASLPQYLFFNNVPELEDDSTAAGSDTTNTILESVNRSLAKGKNRARIENIKEEDEDLGKIVPRSPAMGSFAPKESIGGRSNDVSLMIDESDTIAASPFSKAKKGKKRGRDLLEGTPSRRTRAESKVSTASGRSITDDSVSGERREASPDATLDLDLHDVLHPSILQRGPTSASASSEDSEGHTGERKRKRRAEEIPTTGISDLSRWQKIPIGAFRSSTMSSFQAQDHYSSTTTTEENSLTYRRKSSTSSSINLPLSTNPALRGSTSQSYTLSSPQTTSDMTKKAIERRMLQSPLMGPVLNPSPKSRKVKRKEKKSQSSPQVIGMIPSSVDSSSSRIVESYLTSGLAPITSSSPYLSAQHAYLPSLHSPLFRSTAITSNLE